MTFTLHYDPLLSLVCVLLGIGTQPKVVVFLSTVMICVLNTALYHISDFVCVCVAVLGLSLPNRTTATFRGLFKKARPERGGARTRVKHPIGRWQNGERGVRGHDPVTDRSGHAVSPHTLILLTDSHLRVVVVVLKRGGA